ncbi:MAG: tetratricopeptide repeat protein [Cyanobacteria bacterium SBLK]|nr:tetratricopeptide repeat protein [Cyanobacteria bacterium SBLK]
MNNVQKYLQQAQEFSQQDNFSRAADCYEQALAIEPDNPEIYGYYGVMLSLQGKLDEAKTAWLMVMFAANTEEEQQRWTTQLIETLEQEVEKQTTHQEVQRVWYLRQQIRELNPANFNNSLALLNVIFLLNSYDEAIVLIEEILLDAQTPEQKQKLLNLLYDQALEIGYFHRKPSIASQLAELALSLDKTQEDFVYHLACFYQDSDRFEKGIETAKIHESLVQSLPDRICSGKGVLKALMVTGGHWQESLEKFKAHELLLQDLLKEFPLNLTSRQTSRLFNSYFFAPYIQDRAEENRKIQNQLARLCQENVRRPVQQMVQAFQQGHQQRLQNDRRDRPLKVGYLSYCFKTHSVGWLARSLIRHHDRDCYTLHGYFLANPDSSESLQDWYESQFNRVFKSQDALELARTIYKDKIDILIELDSITMDTTCCLISLKPAPIQVTWLGWDASGIPSIDYFLADPYVLPETAENYYQEKIWRLPDTYIAVDGFEVGIPTLRRNCLSIEKDAIIYYSVQRGYKRNFDTVRLQLQIIKAVSNSYFLLKGASDNEAMKESFLKLAEEEGIERNRLRFLNVDLTETDHRANLGIADIVLDTYPYNGATTTMETLWMGVPLVTRVGQQFSARNSYTMLINAGITEGIAWTDEEYVEWGIQLGKDENLRQKISWQLKKSRYNSPLWDGEKFARNVEKAYQQMWQNYLDKNQKKLI